MVDSVYHASGAPVPLDDGEVTIQQGPKKSLIRLLDHIAAELAEEYVRLMEDAAAADREGEL